MASPRWLICCALALLAAGPSCRGAVVSEQVSLEMRRRAGEIEQRLIAGLPVHVVVFGDSISDGWGTDGTHVYHRMTLDALRYRHPQSQIDTTVVATPGQTTGEALSIVDRRVLALKPDVVIVQFGGNDKGWGRALRDFRYDYAMLLSRLSQSTDALVVACLPPIAEDMGENAWSQTAREVATREGVPWADFHRAIGEGPHDFRGSFPWESHPGSFTHVLMARALLGALDRAFGVEPTFDCRLLRGAELSVDALQVIRAEIISRHGATGTDREQEYEARIELGDQSVDLRCSPGEDGRALIEHRFTVSDTMPSGRAFALPIRLYVRDTDYGGFDVAWLVTAPAVTAPATAAPLAEAEPAWQDIGAGAITVGRHLWTGESDLSARFAASASPDMLRIEVHITDDDLTVSDLTDPSRGDSVEVYLDLRGEQAQGRPVYGPDVLALQVIPARHAPTLWRNIHELPADLRDIQVSSAVSRTGYRVRVNVPMAAITSRRGTDWGGIGLDVGVNDADDGGWRNCQMIWSGTAENYINPGFLGGVWAGELAESATRRVIR